MAESSLVLSIQNRHDDECGEPPEIVSDDAGYYGYFETAQGTQWVFRARPGRGPELFCNWWDWGSPLPLTESARNPFEPNFDHDLLQSINDDVRGWLQACWTASAELRGGLRVYVQHLYGPIRSAANDPAKVAALAHVGLTPGGIVGQDPLTGLDVLRTALNAADSETRLLVITRLFGRERVQLAELLIDKLPMIQSQQLARS